MHHSSRTKVGISIGIMLILVWFGAPAASFAQNDGPPPRCFAETGQCLEGTFQFYWQAQGDLPIFGYPIHPADLAVNTETGTLHLAQWLERARFEVHEENSPPYTILLGRLGEERLRQLGVDWRTLPQEPNPRPGCLWFPETGHNVCDQQPGVGFKTYWQRHGLQDRRLTPYGRSLALFGFPITAAQEEVTSSGERILTQWFERARLEWHPANARPYRVLLGRLGSEVAMNRAPEITIQGRVDNVDLVAHRIGLAAKSNGVDTIVVSAETRITRQSDGKNLSIQDIRTIGVQPQGDALWASGQRQDNMLQATYIVILSQ